MLGKWEEALSAGEIRKQAIKEIKDGVKDPESGSYVKDAHTKLLYYSFHDQQMKKDLFWSLL